MRTVYPSVQMCYTVIIQVTFIPNKETEGSSYGIG